MSDIVVRPYEPRDQEETWNVRAMTYNSGRPIPVEQQVYKTSTPFVGEVDGKVVGTFVIMDMTCTRGSQAAWKMAGIAGVAVAPEARQTGVGNAMMRWSLRHMRENGYVMAALYAFRESYYRRFGYESCGTRQKITCPNSRLPRHKSELPVRRIPYAELDAIKPCYERFARARGGMNLRSEMHWGRIINEEQSKTIYAAGDPVEGYVILEHDWTFWQEQTVGELAWSSVRGYESIISFLGSLGINKTAVSWSEPSDGLLRAKYLDQGIKIEIERPVMYRILNLPAAFEQLGSSGEGEFSMAVRDQELPENNGPWEICYAAGKTQVQRSTSADVELDVREATQVLLGQPSLDDLVRNGTVSDVEAARRLLPPLPVYCIDYF